MINLYPLPWYIIMLVTIPETIFLLNIGFRLYNLKIVFFKLFSISVIQAFLTFFVRHLPVMFGIHTLILMGLLTCTASRVTKTHFGHVFVAVLSGTFIVGMLQSLLLPLLLTYFSVDVVDLAEITWLMEYH